MYLTTTTTATRTIAEWSDIIIVEGKIGRV